MNKFVKDRVFKRSMWTLLTIFFALIMAIFIIVTPITKQYESFVDQFFGIASRKEQIETESTDPADFQYYTSQFATKDENGKYIVAKNNGTVTQVLDKAAMRAHSKAIASQAVSEGTVVLWNNKNESTGKKALPLDKGAMVSPFGLGIIDYVYHGIGSGKVEYNEEDEYLLDVPSMLERDGVGLQVNPNTIQAIKDGKDKGYAVMSGRTSDIPWTEYSNTVKNSTVAYKDAAIYMITRYFGEGSANKNDISTAAYDNDMNMFTLSKAELSVLNGLIELKNKGRIDRVIVTINSPTPFNLKGFDRDNIDACLWIGWGGLMGPSSLGDVLVGNVEPSGHNTDTWAFDMWSAPAAENFGNFTYTSMPDNAPKDHNKYVVYQEGIYVGYRYYETRYEDTVLNQGNASGAAGGVMNKTKWSYTDEMAYTFGYGAGYNDYSYSTPTFNFDKATDTYTVSVTVTNNGTMPGKDAVQVYLQKPYTDYDKQNGIEKTAVELVGFAKTNEIQPGASDTVTIDISEYEFKSYDANGAGTYILENGRYYLSVGQNAHDALNNILTAKGKTTADGMDYNGKEGFARAYDYDKFDAEKYSKGENDTKIENQFDNADLLRNSEMKNQMKEINFKYLSRSNWVDTWRGGIELRLEGEENTKMVTFAKEIPNNPEDKMPVYGTDTNTQFGHLTLVQLMGMPYDDPLWDDLLNQLTFDEQEDLIRNCAKTNVTSIAAPGITQMDGPVGNRRTHMPLPSNPVNACTFNLALMHELGVVFGTEMLAVGMTGVFGLGCNTHRTPWGGRAYEYYSEDGFLSGAISSAETKGMREMGVVLYTKHFALNDQEMNRGVGVNTWSNEQAIREIYLKAFETSIREGDCNGLMTSYNAIGTTWSGQHKGLLTNVLRKEWGFKGITITDAAGTNAYMGGMPSVNAYANLAGQDAWMGNFAAGALKGYYEAGNATVCLAVRESAHRILYTQLHSSMMNGMSADTQIITVIPAWENALVVVRTLSTILTAVCFAMVVASWIVWYLNKNKKNQPEEV